MSVGNRGAFAVKLREGVGGGLQQKIHPQRNPPTSFHLHNPEPLPTPGHPPVNPAKPATQNFPRLAS
jgi:hypothetical protein